MIYTSFCQCKSSHETARSFLCNCSHTTHACEHTAHSNKMETFKDYSKVRGMFEDMGIEVTYWCPGHLDFREDYGGHREGRGHEISSRTRRCARKPEPDVGQTEPARQAGRRNQSAEEEIRTMTSNVGHCGANLTLTLLVNNRTQVRCRSQ